MTLPLLDPAPRITSDDVREGRVPPGWLEPHGILVPAGLLVNTFTRAEHIAHLARTTYLPLSPDELARLYPERT